MNDKDKDDPHAEDAQPTTTVRMEVPMNAEPPYAFYVEDAAGRQATSATVTEEIEGDRKFIVIEPTEWSEPRHTE